MSEKNDGGPAFPFTPNLQPREDDGRWVQYYEPGDPGMSMRDWFAGQFLSGIYACRPNVPGDTIVLEDMQRMAIFAYIQADAMLEARER